MTNDPTILKLSILEEIHKKANNLKASEEQAPLEEWNSYINYRTKYSSEKKDIKKRAGSSNDAKTSSLSRANNRKNTSSYKRGNSLNKLVPLILRKQHTSVTKKSPVNISVKKKNISSNLPPIPNKSKVPRPKNPAKSKSKEIEIINNASPSKLRHTKVKRKSRSPVKIKSKSLKWRGRNKLVTSLPPDKRVRQLKRPYINQLLIMIKERSKSELKRGLKRISKSDVDQRYHLKTKPINNQMRSNSLRPAIINQAKNGCFGEELIQLDNTFTKELIHSKLLLHRIRGVFQRRKISRAVRARDNERSKTKSINILHEFEEILN